MKLHFLGCGSSYPTTKRGVSASLLQHDDGSIWLFDCGEGTQIQAQKVSASRQKINKIFITHLHGDHLFGLPGLLCTISSQIGLTEVDMERKGVPIIDLYGPQGLRLFVYTTLSLSRSPLMFQFRIHELVPVQNQYPEDWDAWPVDHSAPSTSHPSELPGTIVNSTCDNDGNVCWELFEDKIWCVKAGWIHHRVPSFGFVLRERDRPGTLDKSKLLELGIQPGPIYGQLKNGKDITLEDGRLITPEMVSGMAIPGRVLVILGDTNDASPIAHLISSCDVLVHEATHDNTLSERAVAYGHSTPRGAVEFATVINAKVLLLNHFSQRYGPITKDSKVEETVAIIEEQASAAAEGTAVHVQCVDDLFVYEVPLTCRSKT